MGKTKDRSFLARFGSVIAKAGVAAIPRALFRYQKELGLSPQEVWFVAAILSHKWDEELPYPSLSKMAEGTGVSRQQLQNYRKGLVDAGWLNVVPRFVGDEKKAQTSNAYDFSALMEQLETYIKRDKRQGANSGWQGGANSDEQPEPTTVSTNRSTIKSLPKSSRIKKDTPVVRTDGKDFIDQGRFTHLVKH